MRQIERIRLMESHLNQASEAVAALEAALDNYEAAQQPLRALTQYYSSPQWRRDFIDDENGKIPKSLKRGVLSEDAFFNLIEENSLLRKRLNDLSRQE